MNKNKNKYFTGRSGQSGAMLIVIIISMVLVALIGVALHSITATSTLNQAMAQKAAKAYYIAESGLRVANSEYRYRYNLDKDDTVAIDNMLVSLQGKEFLMPNMPNNQQGKFLLDVSPDWVWARTAVPAGTSMTLYFPGNIRTGLTFPTGGILKLNGKTKVAFFNAAPVIGSFSATNGTPITFSFAANYPYPFKAGNEGYIGYAFNSPQTVNAGGNLVLENANNKAAIFPSQNGTIYVEHFATYPPPPDGSGLNYKVISQFTYDKRIPQVIDPVSPPPATVTLQNLQAVSGTTPGFPLNIVYGGNVDNVYVTTRIYLGKTLTIQSTAKLVY